MLRLGRCLQWIIMISCRSQLQLHQPMHNKKLYKHCTKCTKEIVQKCTDDDVIHLFERPLLTLTKHPVFAITCFLYFCVRVRKDLNFFSARADTLGAFQWLVPVGRLSLFSRLQRCRYHIEFSGKILSDSPPVGSLFWPRARLGGWSS